MQISLLTPGQYEPLSRHSLRTVQPRKKIVLEPPKRCFSKTDFGVFQGCSLRLQYFGGRFFPRCGEGLTPVQEVTTACRTCAPTRESRPEPRPSGPGFARPACCSSGFFGSAGPRLAVLRSPVPERRLGRQPPAWTLGACG